MAKLVIFKDNALIRSLPLEREVTIIGRKSDADLVLAHTSVSRHHAKLVCKNGAYTLIDLGSTNGITIDGNKVDTAQLADGHAIGLGDFSILFYGDEAPGGALEAPSTLGSSRILKQDLAVTERHVPRGDYAPLKDSYDALRALIALVRRVSSALDATHLLESMIDCLLDIFAAERGFILLYTSKTGKFDLAIARGIDGQEVHGSVSHTIALKVAKERQELLITDVEAEHQFSQEESIKRDQIRSIICAPLLDKQRTLGIVYLDSRLAKRVFASRDLSFLGAFTAHAAQALVRAMERDALARENEVLRTIGEAQARQTHDHAAIVGSSGAMRETLEQVGVVAPEDTTVLLLGESGTGKELLARAIHSGSRRRDKPFVAVSCVALAEDLVESELFGHEKGAYSGAHERRIGRFELADGGTIFLDEIGDLTPRMQAKLLRVLQERQIERVGSSASIDVDVRIVCATNVDLQAAIAAGRFRSDLYFRIAVFPIRIPPLRERREDVGALAVHYVARFNARLARKHSGVDPDALAHLAAYDWPGNVRELINVMERACLLEKGNLISLASLPPEIAGLKAGARPRRPPGGR